MIDRRIAVFLLLVLVTGCRSAGSSFRTWPPFGRATASVTEMPQKRSSLPSRQRMSSPPDSRATATDGDAAPSSDVILTASNGDEATREDNPVTSPEDGPNSTPSADARVSPVAPLQLNDVVQSIYASYPLLQVAIYGRNIAAGEQLSAEGAWDLKLKADANNAPIGYYKNYRNGVGFEQPTMWGGEVFGGYRLGRGDIEPWYGGRQTNDGGEFAAGIRIPLAQNRAIDERRAALWKATYGVGAVEPFIQAQIIEFIRAGSHAYWNWTAAGLNLGITRELLELAEERDDQIDAQVKAGARPESLLIDNHRLIVSRQVKLIEARRKLQTAAVKLSLFLRTPDGQPVIPTEEQLPGRFPTATAIAVDRVPLDVAEAVARRPELTELDFQHRMAQVDLQHAQNQTLPELDATLWNAKDAGGWSDSKGTKTPYQAEAGLEFSVPLQRRKALGKITAVEGKLVQIATKRRFAEDKIATEVQSTVITIDAAYRSIGKAHESVKLNEQMQQFEVVKLEKGDSDLLLVNLREAATFDARVIEIEALLHYFESQADYRAAMALDVAEFGFLGEAVPPPVPALQPEPVQLPAP